MVENNSSNEKIEKVLSKCSKGTVIAEFSGRDSVAAIIEEIKGKEKIEILPIASFATTEYGNSSDINLNYNKLIENLQGKNSQVKINELLYYSYPEIWKLLNGRYISLLINKYKFYNPCIGCHMYFHLLKIPFAKKIDGKVLAGERESHGGKVKVNQLKICLDAYKYVMEQFGVELLMPIRNVKNNEEIDKLIPWEWEEGKNHPECSLSGNYRSVDGKAIYDMDNIKSYINGFLIPVSLLIGKYLIGEMDFDCLNEKIEAII